MKRRGLLIALVLLVALGVGCLVWGRRARKPVAQMSTVTVERGTVERLITADGTLRPKTKVSVKSYAGGNVDLLAVEVGDVVRKGDLIARIDPTDSRSTYEQAAADVDAARAQLDQAREKAQAQPAMTQASIAQAEASYAAALTEVESLRDAEQPQTRAEAQSALNKAQANLDLAETELARMQQLMSKGYVPQSDVDTAVNKRDLAASELASAKQRWQTLERQLTAELDTARAKAAQAKAALESARANAVQDRIARSDVTSAQAQIARAQAQFTQAKTTLGYTTITAPRDGVILDKYVEAGTIVTSGRSSVTAGTDIVLLGDITEMFVDVSVNEADVGMVKTGQSAAITVDAFPDDRFHGTITRIDPQAVTEQNVTTVLVTVRVDDANPRLRPGMTATCEFPVGRAENVLFVPNLAVQQQGSRRVVFVRVGDQSTPIPVEIGLVGDNFTEIRSGVSEGAEVVLPFQSASQSEGDSRGQEMGRRMGGAGGFVRGQ